MERIDRPASSLVAVAAALLALAAPARATMLPPSERLDPVRPALERTLDQAARDGLPSDLIVRKVREGLAKGAAPEVIRAAAERLARSLADADQFLRAHRKGADPALLRALAEARSAAIDLEVVAPLVDCDASDAALARAVDALTELVLRGYPSQAAALVIKEALARDPSAVGQVVAGVEALRAGRKLAHRDALEAFARSLAPRTASAP
jgi:hypothetical protein